jgi:hypothetical protein
MDPLSLAKMCRDADEMTTKRRNLRSVVYPVCISPFHARLRADTLLILVFLGRLSGGTPLIEWC